MGKVILLVTHKASKCGIYEYGIEIYNAIKNSKEFRFVHVECDSLPELYKAIKLHSPSVIIYNYNQSVMPWLRFPIIPTKAYLNLSFFIRVPQIGIIHEVTQAIADSATSRKFFIKGAHNLINRLFDAYIVPDPTYFGNSALIHKVGRIVPEYDNSFGKPEIPTFGSFGFATQNKGFEKIIDLVCREYDNAKIRINMPPSTFGDPDGSRARMIAEKCRKNCEKPGVSLEITHNYLDSRGVLDFLATNTANIFLYTNPSSESRGISSVVEKALAVSRPICISDSEMFRHVSGVEPTIRISQTTLSKIVSDGFSTELQSLKRKWTSEQMMRSYEKICESVLIGIK